MKQLQPIRIKQKYHLGIEKKIQEYFDRIFYRPIIDAIKRHTKTAFLNSSNPVRDALNSGKIQYADGKFTGKFNASISKQLKEIGAKWSKKGYWVIKKNDLPAEIISAIVTSEDVFKKMNSDVVESVEKIQHKIIDFGQEYEKIIVEVDREFLKTVDGVEAIGVVPEITEQMKESIVKEYNDNMDKFIKNWTVENIKKLRGIVEKNSLAGYRAENLVKGIMKNRSVSMAKATFLAKQETSLFVSKLREERYKDVGVRRYRWSSSKDERVRDRHKDLDGKVFDWDNPPIVDDKGRRAHPGEDFGCRCVAIPQIGF